MDFEFVAGNLGFRKSCTNGLLECGVGLRACTDGRMRFGCGAFLCCGRRVISRPGLVQACEKNQNGDQTMMLQEFAPFSYELSSCSFLIADLKWPGMPGHYGQFVQRSGLSSTGEIELL